MAWNGIFVCLLIDANWVVGVSYWKPLIINFTRILELFNRRSSNLANPFSGTHPQPQIASYNLSWARFIATMLYRSLNLLLSLDTASRLWLKRFIKGLNHAVAATSHPKTDASRICGKRPAILISFQISGPISALPIRALSGTVVSKGVCLWWCNCGGEYELILDCYYQMLNSSNWL